MCSESGQKTGIPTVSDFNLGRPLITTVKTIVIMVVMTTIVFIAAKTTFVYIGRMIMIVVLEPLC